MQPCTVTSHVRPIAVGAIEHRRLDRRVPNRVGDDPSADDEDRLAGWCREGLRRWPHNPILLRKCAKDTSLGGTAVSKDDDVFLWTHAAMYDAQAFINPTTMRHDRPARSYLHFGAGLHPCAGRVINAFQIPLLVGALVRRGIKSVGAIQWAGSFPGTLIVTFAR